MPFNPTFWLTEKWGRLLLVKSEPQLILGGPWKGTIVNGKTHPPKGAIAQKKLVKECHPGKYVTTRTYTMTKKVKPQSNVIPFPVKKPKVRTRLATFL
jgi:hypothetical protein